MKKRQLGSCDFSPAEYYSVFRCGMTEVYYICLHLLCGVGAAVEGFVVYNHRPSDGSASHYDAAIGWNMVLS